MDQFMSGSRADDHILDVLWPALKCVRKHAGMHKARAPAAGRMATVVVPRTPCEPAGVLKVEHSVHLLISPIDEINAHRGRAEQVRDLILDCGELIFGELVL